MSVVDGRLHVYGVDSLRIADASIMPRIAAASTMAPCVVIGERAAQFIKRNVSSEACDEIHVSASESGESTS